MMLISNAFNSVFDVSTNVLQARGISGTTKFPKIGCSYIPPDQCSDYTPPTCCERINAGMVLRTSVAVLLVLSALAVIMG